MNTTTRLRLMPASPAPPRQLAPSLQPDHSWGEDYNLLVCPVCAFDYCHIGDVRHQSTEKGSRLIIAIWGECGHAFDAVLFQHKGQTFASVENIRHVGQEQWPRGRGGVV